MNLFLMPAALLVAMGPSSAASPRLFTSPDRSIMAVISVGPTRESRVEIQTARKRILLVRDETSNDGSHGYGVIHAAWTLDSQFFVASTEAASGHQPWARPIWVYSRAKNQVFELTKFQNSDLWSSAYGDL